MLFVAVGKARPGTLRERSGRRLTWQYPETGAEVVAEYWLQTADPALIVVLNASSMTQVWPTLTAWDDVFDISVFPAVAAEEGIAVLKQLARAPA